MFLKLENEKASELVGSLKSEISISKQQCSILNSKNSSLEKEKEVLISNVAKLPKSLS